MPKNNAAFWKAKFEANVRRDRRNLRKLRNLGYQVMTVWECETKTAAKRVRLERRLAAFLSEDRNAARTILKQPLVTDRGRRNGPPDQGREAPSSPPTERYLLSSDGRAIERIIGLRAGGSARSRVSVVADEIGEASDDVLADFFDRAFLRSKSRPRLGPRKREVRVVDLFSGCGAMSLGIWEASRAVGARMVPVMALDSNQTALDVYEKNFPGVWAVGAAVETILDGALGSSASSAERALVARVGQVDVLVGGPPCQGHSNLNNHTRRKDPKNKLYDRMARFAELVRPKHVIIENVSAVLHDEGKVVARTIEHLTALDYEIDDDVIQAADLGVPQRRRRHFVVASHERVPDIVATVAAYKRGPRTVTWAIGDLSHIVGNGTFETTGKTSETNQKRIAHLFDNELYELPDDERPDCHRLEEHSYKSVYGRLRPHEPAQTITSGFVSMGQGRYVHPTKRRTITAHEAARLQFIPDFFDFRGVSKRTALAEMIGNGVPSKLPYVLGVELLR